VVTGVTALGSISTFQIQLSSTPTSSSTIARLIGFQTTLDDITHSGDLGLIDNHGIANSLSSKIQAAQNASGIARKNILNAFQNQLKAETGKHINATAANILLHDAESLLTLK